MSFLLVSIGAIFGSGLRYLFTLIFSSGYGVLFANILGSFIAGIFFVLIHEKTILSDAYRLALIVGFCGSLTTLSALSLEGFNMINNGNYALASLNLLGNIILSLLFVGFGVYLMRLSFT